MRACACICAYVCACARACVFGFLCSVSPAGASLAQDGNGLLPTLGQAQAPDVVETLVAGGASVNAPVHALSGLTALHVAPNARLAQALLAAGAEVNARGRCGSTPLHKAHSAGIVRVLVNAGMCVWVYVLVRGVVLCVWGARGSVDEVCVCLFRLSSHFFL